MRNFIGRGCTRKASKYHRDWWRGHNGDRVVVTMLRLISVFLALLAGAADAAGPRSRAVSAPDPSVMGKSERNDVQISDTGNNDTNSKTVRSLTINTGIRNLVLLTFGQSNCENVAPSAYGPANGTVLDNFNVLNGQMYAAVD